MSFYAKLLHDLVAEGRLDCAAPTLVVAGDEHDCAILREAGFTDVTISNLEDRTGDEFRPFAWLRLDAEALALDDGSFEQVIEHMGLHHCALPHAGLLEMTRVARRAALAIENRDSLTMRLAVKLGLSGEYEVDTVRDNDFATGGLRDSPIPNFVYRWTEREVIKLLSSYDPVHAHAVRFYYGARYPDERAGQASSMRRALLAAGRVPYALLTTLFPSQANVFGIYVDKAGARLQPWMNAAGDNLGDARQGLGA
jgi:hypothetical protein